LLALPDRVFYPHYAEAPRLFGLSALDDQALGGGIMWSMAHMYLLPILLLVAKILNRQEQAAREVEAGNN
ncbi:MAG: cytochrome c oxidase assembly protein, partial [Candidatus Rokuibacteriota bacterium]